MNPITLIIIFACITAIPLIIIAYELLSRKNIIKKIDQLFTFILFIFIYGLSPLSPLHPQDLVLGDASFTKIAVRLLFYALVVIFFREWFKGFIQNSSVLLKDPFLSLLILIALLSFIWSETPGLTLRSSLAGLSIAMLAAHVAKKYHWKQIDFFLRYSFLLVTIFSLTPLVGPGRVIGYIIGLNLGLWFWHSTSNSKQHWARLGVIISSVFVFLRVFAAGSFNNLFTLLLLVLNLKLLKKFKPRQVPIAIISILIFCILGSFLLSENMEGILATFGKETTLTGRTEFWPQLMAKLGNKLFTGYGYGGFWQPWRGQADPAFDIFIPGYIPPHSHNGFIEVALQLGVPGSLMFIASYLRTVYLAVLHFEKKQVTEAAIPILVLAYVVLSQLAETARLGLIGPNYIWFLFILINVRLNLESKSSVTNLL